MRKHFLYVCQSLDRAKIEKYFHKTNRHSMGIAKIRRTQYTAIKFSQRKLRQAPFRNRLSMRRSRGSRSNPIHPLRQPIGRMRMMHAAGFVFTLPMSTPPKPISYGAKKIKTRRKNPTSCSQCPGQDSNLHERNCSLPPQSSVSTNFTTWAFQNRPRRPHRPSALVSEPCFPA